MTPPIRTLNYKMLCQHNVNSVVIVAIKSGLRLVNIFAHIIFYLPLWVEIKVNISLFVVQNNEFSWAMQPFMIITEKKERHMLI